ncbi:MAG: hypothetical protein NZZ60_04405 [Bacteroidia bacterium]|nr:hypothetical protein [Bacteroidia bacterium]MCX7651372.1 hypothetical protein [Bacteroidia bacterium]MDW8416728.1 hypothetical protein [Bacteroidia bacterium]
MRYFWFWILGFSIGFWGGCKRGSCEGVECLNGGRCRGGRCDCPVGFGGGRCEQKWSDGWVGNYTVDDRCRVVGLIPQYNATISPSSIYPDVIYLEGFGDIRCEGQPLRVEARLISADRIEIGRQSSCNRRYTIEGSGWRNSDYRIITVEYYYHDFQTGLRDTCRAEWRRY